MLRKKKLILFTRPITIIIVSNENFTTFKSFKKFKYIRIRIYLISKKNLVILFYKTLDLVNYFFIMYLKYHKV